VLRKAELSCEADSKNYLGARSLAWESPLNSGLASISHCG